MHLPATIPYLKGMAVTQGDLRVSEQHSHGICFSSYRALTQPVLHIKE